MKGGIVLLCALLTTALALAGASATLAQVEPFVEGSTVVAVGDLVADVSASWAGLVLCEEADASALFALELYGPIEAGVAFELVFTLEGCGTWSDVCAGTFDDQGDSLATCRDGSRVLVTDLAATPVAGVGAARTASFDVVVHAALLSCRNGVLHGCDAFPEIVPEDGLVHLDARGTAQGVGAHPTGVTLPSCSPDRPFGVPGVVCCPTPPPLQLDECILD